MKKESFIVCRIETAIKEKLQKLSDGNISKLIQKIIKEWLNKHE